MGARGMPRTAQLSVRGGFGQMRRGWRETARRRSGRRLLPGLGVALVLASLLLLLALADLQPGRSVARHRGRCRRRAIFSASDGALVADILLQSVGLAAYLVPAVLFGWAFRLMLQRPIRRPVRGSCCCSLALVLGAAACSILRLELALPAGAGGVDRLAAAGRASSAPGSARRPAAGDGGGRAGRARCCCRSSACRRRDWRDLGSGAGRGAAGLPASRGAARRRRRRSASACSAHWRRGAARSARPGPDRWRRSAGDARCRRDRRSVVTPLPDRREPQFERGGAPPPARREPASRSEPAAALPAGWSAW